MSDKLVRGPLMDMYVDGDAKLCRENWWATLLYVNNYVYNLAPVNIFTISNKPHFTSHC